MPIIPHEYLFGGDSAGAYDAFVPNSKRPESFGLACHMLLGKHLSSHELTEDLHRKAGEQLASLLITNPDKRLVVDFNISGRSTPVISTETGLNHSTAIALDFIIGDQGLIHAAQSSALNRTVRARDAAQIAIHLDDAMEFLLGFIDHLDSLIKQGATPSASPNEATATPVKATLEAVYRQINSVIDQVPQGTSPRKLTVHNKADLRNWWCEMANCLTMPLRNKPRDAATALTSGPSAQEDHPPRETTQPLLPATSFPNPADTMGKI